MLLPHSQHATGRIQHACRTAPDACARPTPAAAQHHARAWLNASAQGGAVDTRSNNWPRATLAGWCVARAPKTRQGAETQCPCLLEWLGYRLQAYRCKGTQAQTGARVRRHKHTNTVLTGTAQQSNSPILLLLGRGTRARAPDQARRRRNGWGVGLTRADCRHRCAVRAADKLPNRWAEPADPARTYRSMPEHSCVCAARSSACGCAAGIPRRLQLQHDLAVTDDLIHVDVLLLQARQVHNPA